MYDIKSQKQLERVARTAEALVVHIETKWDDSYELYIEGPVQEDGKPYWPDVCTISTDVLDMTTNKYAKCVKVTGRLVRFQFNNGHGLYQILGEHELSISQQKFHVALKISSSVDFSIPIPKG